MMLLAQVQTLNRFDQAFVRLVDQALASPALIAVAAGAAFGVGALHALAPGHGKSVAAAYLVAGRGRLRDAFLLGGVVAAMHTLSVVVLALGLEVLLRSAGAASQAAAVTPVLRILSGIVVLGLGVALLVRQWRARTHEHDHGHDLPDDVSPLSRRGLVLLGAAGGLLPSPSAFLVLVTTAFSGRTWLGLLLVAVFSLGLATTLTLVGVAVLRGRQALLARLGTQRQHQFVRAAARMGAVVIVAGGAVLTAAGIVAL